MQSSNLWRPIDFNYATNVAVTLLASLAAIAGSLAQLFAGRALIPGLIWGAKLGFTLFLTWALAREADPDQPLAAFPAAGIGLVAALIFDMPNLLAALWSILIFRLVNRCVGKRASRLDSLGVLGLGAFLTYKSSWPYGLTSALAFAMDSRLPKPQKPQLWFANAALLFTVAAAILGPPRETLAGWSGTRLAVVFGSAFLFGLVILRSRRVTSVADRTGERLHPLRVQSAQVLGVVVGLLGAWWGGWSEVIALGPLWAAMLGAGAYQIAVALPGAILRDRTGTAR